MIIPKSKRNLKFLLKVQYEDEEAIINKIAPVLNQLSIEETSTIDDFLFPFFTDHYQPEFGDETITTTVNYLIWKNPNLYHQLKIKPFLFYEYYFKYEENLLKNINYYNKFVVYKNSKDFKFRNFIASFFFFYLVEGAIRNINVGPISSFKNFYNSMPSVVGIRRSYSKRTEMLGRKINFRRKVRKQRFEDY